MKFKSQTTVFLGLLLIFFILAISKQPQVFYPVVKVEVPNPSGSLGIDFLFHGKSTLHDCETINGNIAREIFSKCTQCKVTLIQCLTTLNAEQQSKLSTAALPTASGRMENGVIVFNSVNPSLELSACMASENQSASGNNPIKCYSANTLRPKITTRLSIDPWLIAIILVAFAAAWFSGWIIVKYENLHAHLSHDHITDSPQKLHAQPTPRIGGLMLIIAMLAAGGVMVFAETFSIRREFGLLLLASIPAFFGGLVEDITKKVGVMDRLLLTMLSGVVAAWILGAVLNRLDVPGADQVMKWLPFAVIFTSFAVSGIANAINIIDGFNGLASGFSVIMLIPLAYVAYLVNDPLVFDITVALAGALLGFLAWNWPNGKIFMGDGGAYLLGFLLAELCVLLLARNSSVTPWFALLLFIHPVFETLFSVFRRKYLRGHSPGKPDALHFHTLIYKRIVPREANSGIIFSQLQRNSRVAKYVWIPGIVTAIYAVIFWESIPALILGICVYCIFYCAVFRGIVKWKNVGDLPVLPFLALGKVRGTRQ
jgi:UDP-N-acetylmuramyl pentapeptide phosphotransferase/UDP-N-acetylglucosamine-1-phosphate transferase